MKPGADFKIVKVGELLRQRLKATGRSTEELAEVAQVPEAYIAALISGKRRPPLPSRTDIYEKVTRFLQLGRNDLALCASAERAETTRGKGSPDPEIRQQVLAMCDPETATELERRARKDDTELVDLMGRLLDVAQGSVRRMLEDQVALRGAAARNGASYIEMRLRVLEFLDATPDTLTEEDLASFVRPRIARWDVDLQSGVLKVVLAAQDTHQPNRRKPTVRGGKWKLAG